MREQTNSSDASVGHTGGATVDLVLKAGNQPVSRQRHGLRAGPGRFGDRREGRLCTDSFEQARDDIFRAEHAAFLDAIDGRRAPETSAAGGLVSTAICEAALASWRTGREAPVEWGDT